MVWRTSGGTEALHLLYEEWDKRAGVLDTGFRLLVEIGLVGATAALRHA